MFVGPFCCVRWRSWKVLCAKDGGGVCGKLGEWGLWEASLLVRQLVALTGGI